MSLICLAAGVLLAPLGETVILRWTHSVQHTVWEETYRLKDGALNLSSARVRGTGAGMEPPPEAIWRDGAWHYTPTLPPLPALLLRHSPYVPAYVLCAGGDCRTAPSWLPGLPNDAILELRPCGTAGSGDARPPPVPESLVSQSN